MTKAVIFDMDGTIIDSEKLHLKAWEILFLREKGIKLDEKDFDNLVGVLDIYAVRYFFKKYKVRGNVLEWRLKKKRILMKILKENVKMFPGVKALIVRLSKKYKVAIATSSWDQEVKIVKKKFGLGKYITKTIGKEDIRNHKPHPQIYQTMAKRLKVDESECVVIEDSVPGVLAAKRAKCMCIAVTNTNPANKLRKADLVVKDIRDKRVWSFISN